MRNSLAILIAATLIAATPAVAGNLTFDNGQTAWHSTQCTKPNPPTSVYSAKSDTSGEDMNSLISQHNAYVDAAQNYMNCISSEADHDQNMVDQAIASSAQKAIGDVQNDLNASAAQLHAPQ